MRNRFVANSPTIAPTLWLMILYFGCQVPSFAQGGPPMLTDDPGTPGADQWEINTAVLAERTADMRILSVPHVDFNYGLGEHIQLKYETGYLFADASGSSGVKSGFDDSLLGLKWHFLDQQRVGVDVSVYPQLVIENSSASVNRGVAEPAPNLLLSIEVGHAFGRVTLIGEVGYRYRSTRNNECIAGFLVALEASESLELLSEIRSVSETPLSGGDVIVNVGLREALGSRIKLLASAGTGLRSGPDTTRLTAYLGIQLMLGDKR